MCASELEVDAIDAQENKKLLDFTHLIKAAKKRIAKGEIPKAAKKSASENKSSGALEYLRNFRAKAKQ